MKYVFIDMDNTIAENTTCKDIEYFEGLYLNKRPINIVINAIKTLYKNSEYIFITQVTGGSEAIDEKIKWLNKYFGNYEDCFFLSLQESKAIVIDSVLKSKNIEPKDCLLIDDKKSILQECLKLGINVKYPQQIICDYEELSQK